MFHVKPQKPASLTVWNGLFTSEEGMPLGNNDGEDPNTRPQDRKEEAYDVCHVQVTQQNAVSLSLSWAAQL